MKSTKSWLAAALVAAFVLGGANVGKGLEYNKKTTPHEITLRLYFEPGSLDHYDDSMARLDQWKGYFDDAAYTVWNYTDHQAGIKEVQVYRYKNPKNCDVIVKNGTAYKMENGSAKINKVCWPHTHIYKCLGKDPKQPEITLPHDIHTIPISEGSTIAHEMGHSIFGVADEYKVYCWEGGNFEKAKNHLDFDYSNARFFDFREERVLDHELLDRFVKCDREDKVYEVSPTFSRLKANNINFLGDVATAFGNDIPGPRTIMNDGVLMSTPNQGNPPWEWNMHYRKWEGGLARQWNTGHATWGNLNFATCQEFMFHKSAWERMKETRGVELGGKAGDCPYMEWHLMEGSPVCLIVLDSSGSMRGAKWLAAMAAAKLAVGMAWLSSPSWGGDYVGVIKFASSPATVFSPVEMTDKATRTAHQREISGSASGGTGIDAALWGALSELNALRTEATGPECIILLSDGQSQDTVTDVTLDKLNQRGVTVHTVAYGSDADRALLRRIASATGGKMGSIFSFWSARKSTGSQSRSLLSTDNLSQFFAELYAEGRESEQTTRLEGVATGGPVEQEIVVDSYGNIDLTINLYWETGDMDVALVKPDGTVIERAAAEAAETDLDGGKETDSAFIRVNNPEAGTWKVRVIPESGSGDQAYLATVSCTGRDNMRMYVGTSGDAKTNALTWPEPLVISASFGGAVPAITGAMVTAVATCPDGTEVPFTLNDDGENGDEVEGDGVYSAEFTAFTEDGEYRFDIEGKNVSGKTSWRGYSPAEGGNLPEPKPVEPFVRRKSLTVQYDGLPEFINATRYTGTEFASWTLNRNTGAMTGSLVVSNQPTSRKTLIAPFWYAVTETVNVTLAKVDGYTDDGDPYVNITDKVEAALMAKYGRKSMAPGEWVAIDGVEVYSRDRSIPDMTALWSLWADPPAGAERRIDSYDRDSDGVLDDEEILLAVEHWEALDMDDEALLKRIALWKQGEE